MAVTSATRHAAPRRLLSASATGETVISSTRCSIAGDTYSTCSRFTATRSRSVARIAPAAVAKLTRSEEHTSELQSQSNLVCRLLLEKKKKKTNTHHKPTNIHT